MFTKVEATDNKGAKPSIDNTSKDFISQFNEAINNGTIDSLGLKKVDLSTTGGMIEITEKQSGKFYVRDIGNDTFELYPDKDVSNRAYEALFKPWCNIQRNGGDVINVTKPLLIKDNKFSGRYDLLAKGEVAINAGDAGKSSNNLEIKTKKEYNGNADYSLMSNEENDDILDEKDIISYVPIRKVKLKTFPPRNESQSDANEWSTRWAHREEVESGAQKIKFYHNRCYVIEKFDSLPLKYQIVGSIKHSDYEIVRKGLEDARNRYEQPEEEMARIVGSSDGRYNSDGGRRPSIDYSSVEHGREDREVWGLGKKQDGKREIQSDNGRSNEYDGEDRKVESLNENKQLSLKKEIDLLAKGEVAINAGDAGKSSNNLENQAKEVYNGDVNYALKQWHTGLSKAQIEMVEKWIRRVGSPESKRIAEYTYWYNGRLDGRDLFVLYSTEDTDSPTILYLARGKQAKLELGILMDLLKEEEYGKSINGKSSFAQRVSKRDWVRNVNSSQGNLQHVGAGPNSQNVGVLPRQSQRNGSPAFRNVIEHCFGKQSEVNSQNPKSVKSNFSLKQKDSEGNTLTSNEKPTSNPDINFSLKDTKISIQDVRSVQNIGAVKGRISVNDFDSNDIKATENFARKYFPELGVKSPFFRAFFGDWRANDETPVMVATKKGADRGITKNKDNDWDIQISGKVFSETTTHENAQSKAAVPYLPYINSIVENAVLFDSCTMDEPKSSNSAMMHSLYAVADIGHGKEVLKLFVEELNDVNSDGTIKRSYKLIMPAASARVQVSLSSVTNTASNINNIADLFDIVKQKDKDFNPKPSSLVVNKDGTPKVIYHTTSDKFTVFDITKSRSWDGTVDYDLPGFYFAENYEDSAAYGDNTMACYVKITKPYSGNIYQLAKEKGSYRKAYEYLIKQGYDGVIIDEFGEGFNEYIVLKSENIKSATDNIGTFDKNNKDINFSLKRENSESASKRRKEFFDAIEDLQNGKGNAVSRLSKYVDSGLISTEQYGELVQKYGAIKRGERPHRDVQVPKNSADGKKVSQTVRTILEAKATPNEAIPTIEKMVEDGVFSYDVYTDRQAIEEAASYIKKHGWIDSLRDWFDSVEKGVV